MIEMRFDLFKNPDQQTGGSKKPKKNQTKTKNGRSQGLKTKEQKQQTSKPKSQNPRAKGSSGSSSAPKVSTPKVSKPKASTYRSTTNAARSKGATTRIQRNTQKPKSSVSARQTTQRQNSSSRTDTRSQSQNMRERNMAASEARRQEMEADRKRREEESKARRNEFFTKPKTADEMKQQRENADNNLNLKQTQAAKTRDRNIEVAKNTGRVAAESAKQAGIGHLKTLSDVTDANKSAAIGSRADFQTKEFQKDLSKRREASTRVNKKAFSELMNMQDESEKKIQEVTKNAKGLEKSYYNAVESGVGMLTDVAIGLGSQGGALAAMASRTYGSTRGKAQKEGATLAEDRLYSVLQATKEVGTELMFPGIGVASKFGKRAGIHAAEKAANALTKNLTGRTADITRAGIRLIGGTAEENAEEVVGWGLDPIIKEYTPTSQRP